MSSVSDPSMLVITASTFADLCFPGICVVALYRSFLSGLLVHPRLPMWLRNLLTCPLCLGFHVTWMWMCVRCFILTPHAHYPILDWVMFPATGGVIAYVFENTLTVLVSLGSFLDSARSIAADDMIIDVTGGEDEEDNSNVAQMSPMTVDEEAEEARGFR